MALENKKLDKEEKTPDLAWLDDPEVFRVGQIKAHSDHHFFDGEETYQKQEESLCQCLNGTWQFAWSKNPAGFLQGSRRCIRIWNHPGARTYGTGWF